MDLNFLSEGPGTEMPDSSPVVMLTLAKQLRSLQWLELGGAAPTAIPSNTLFDVVDLEVILG